MCIPNDPTHLFTTECTACKVLQKLNPRRAQNCVHRGYMAVCKNRTNHPKADFVYFRNAEIGTFNGCGYCKWAEKHPLSNDKDRWNNPGWPGCCRPPQSADDWAHIPQTDHREICILYGLIPPSHILSAATPARPVAPNGDVRRPGQEGFYGRADDNQLSRTPTRPTAFPSPTQSPLHQKASTTGTGYPRRDLHSRSPTNWTGLKETSSPNSTIRVHQKTVSSPSIIQELASQPSLTNLSDRKRPPVITQSSRNGKATKDETPTKRSSSKTVATRPLLPKSPTSPNVVIPTAPRKTSPDKEDGTPPARRRSLDRTPPPVKRVPRPESRPESPFPPKPESPPLPVIPSSSPEPKNFEKTFGAINLSPQTTVRDSLSVASEASSDSFTDYMSSESEAELQRRVEEEAEFKDAKRGLQEVDLRLPKDWYTPSYRGNGSLRYQASPNASPQARYGTTSDTRCSPTPPYAFNSRPTYPAYAG